MEVNVVAHEGGDEVVGVVVEGLHPQLHVVAVLGCCHEEVLWLQLVLQEAVSCALVNQDGRLTKVIDHRHPDIVVKIHLGPRVGGDQLSGIIRFSRLHRAEVTSEGLRRHRINIF